MIIGLAGQKGGSGKTTTAFTSPTLSLTTHASCSLTPTRRPRP